MLEQGKSPVEIFALRGRSLPWVASWTVAAVAAIGFTAVNGGTEWIEVTTVVLAAFIPVCFLRVYFENYDFVEQFVKETKERMRYLLFEGLGVDENTFESVSSAVETVLVEFWTKRLTKRWTEFSESEIGEFMFDSGIETAKEIAEKFREDVQWSVFAFMREWQTYVERIRVPMRAKEELEGDSESRETIDCIAIILANETPEVRDTRARHSQGANFPFLPTAGRSAARNAATEGILLWPSCHLRNPEVEGVNIGFDTAELSAVSEGVERPCVREDIPDCVVYTLRKMIEAGFLRLSPNGKTNVYISFQDEKMVFERKDWRFASTIERRPFRYITFVTLVNGNPAFTIERRGVIDGVVFVNGSRSLKGILGVEVNATVRAGGKTWLHDAELLRDEAKVWGMLESFVEPMPLCVASRLVLWMIRAVSDVVRWIKKSPEHFRN